MSEKSTTCAASSSSSRNSADFGPGSPSASARDDKSDGISCEECSRCMSRLQQCMCHFETENESRGHLGYLREDREVMEAKSANVEAGAEGSVHKRNLEGEEKTCWVLIEWKISVRKWPCEEWRLIASRCRKDAMGTMRGVFTRYSAPSTQRNRCLFPRLECSKTDMAYLPCSAEDAVSNAESLHAVHLRSDGGWMELTGGIDGEPLADSVSGSVGKSGVSRWSSVGSVGGEYEIVSFSVQPMQLDRPLAAGERVVSASGQC